MLSHNIKVAAIESDIVWADKTANIEALKESVTKIAPDTDLVVLPEMFSTGFIGNDKQLADELAERNTQDSLHTVQQLADEYNVAFCGSFLARTASRIYNRAFFIEPGGEETYYDKLHLFGVGGENEIFTAGTKASPIIRFRGINIKLVVCYDLRFPVFCRNVNNNYDVLVVVANWPKSRQYAWRQLITARAIENEAYVVAVNRSGVDNNGTDYGERSSYILDYKGRIMVQRDSENNVISAELSLAKLNAFREKFPAWRDADKFELL